MIATKKINAIKRRSPFVVIDSRYATIVYFALNEQRAAQVADRRNEICGERRYKVEPNYGMLED